MAAYAMKSDNVFLRCFDKVAIEVYKLESPYTFPKTGKSWDNLGIRIGPGNKYEVLKIGDKEMNNVELKTLIKDLFNSRVIVNREGLCFLATAGVTAAALEVEYYRMFDLFDWSKYHVNTSLNTRWARRDFVDGRPLDVVKPNNSDDCNEEKKIIRELEMKLENQKRKHKEEIEEVELEKREELKKKDDEIEKLKEELLKKKQDDTKEKQEVINERKKKDDEIEKLKEELTKERKKQEDATKKKQGEINELTRKHKEELTKEREKQEDASTKKQGEIDELKRKHKEELSKERNKQEDTKKKYQDEIDELKRKNREQMRKKQAELNDLDNELKIYSFARSGYEINYSSVWDFYYKMLQKIRDHRTSFKSVGSFRQDVWPPTYGTRIDTYVPLVSMTENIDIQVTYNNPIIPTIFDKTNWRVLWVVSSGRDPVQHGFEIRRSRIAYYAGNRYQTDGFVYGSGVDKYKAIIRTPMTT